jgi:hypothetical protein
LGGSPSSLATEYLLHAKPRHEFVYIYAELTRPCPVNLSSASHHAVEMPNELVTHGR